MKTIQIGDHALSKFLNMSIHLTKDKAWDLNPGGGKRSAIGESLFFSSIHIFNGL